MQSKYQEDTNCHPEDLEAFAPIRPEPLLPSHSTIYEVAFPNKIEERRSGSDARTGLAAAFRKMDRAVDPEAAYEQAKDFYKSSGHDRTHDLDR